jgi:curli production assembly/transport component CsgG
LFVRIKTWKAPRLMNEMFFNQFFQPRSLAMPNLRLRLRLRLSILVLPVFLWGCVLPPALKPAPPGVVATTNASADLHMKSVVQPQNGRQMLIGVYGCHDSTGQKKVTRIGAADFSSAVLQDCGPLLSAALRGFPQHYRVLERGRIDDMLKERQLAQAMFGDQSRNLLGNLLISDVLMLGQIVSYDRTTTQGTGGFAVNAIGMAFEHVSDTLTFSLRAVSTKTGEILSDVLVKKSVESLQANGHVLKIIGVNTGSLEYGAASNEPAGIALQQAVEFAVVSITQKGIDVGWWVD